MVSSNTVPAASAARKSGWKNPNETYVNGIAMPRVQPAVAAAAIAAATPSVRTAARKTERRVSSASRKSASAKIAPQ